MFVFISGVHLKKTYLRQLINLSLIGLFAILFGCQTKTDEQTVSNDKNALKFPVIIDSAVFKASKREASWLSTANYNLLYIGKWKDTLFPDYSLKYYQFVPPPPPPTESQFDPTDTIGYHKRLIEHVMFPYYIEWTASHNYKSWQEAEITIVVDTAQRVLNADEYIESESAFFEAYPVLITNIGKDTIAIGHGHYLPLITEAKDSTGNWKPIEEKRIYKCGNALGTIILPPNEIGLSSTMIYHGNHPTIMRLRMVNSFSNEFRGNINYHQFESTFNDKEISGKNANKK